MALFNESELRQTFQNESTIMRKAIPYDYSSAKTLLNTRRQWDIFLSHRYKDRELIIGLAIKIVELGYSVFVDWIENPEIDRGDVTKENADFLREAMKKCGCLFYAVTQNSHESTWMPWELGYSDALHGKVAIVPITPRPTATDSYTNSEYLGLYPYATSNAYARRPGRDIWIREAENIYTPLPSWLAGEKPKLRTP